MYYMRFDLPIALAVLKINQDHRQQQRQHLGRMGNAAADDTRPSFLLTDLGIILTAAGRNDGPVAISIILPRSVRENKVM